MSRFANPKLLALALGLVALGAWYGLRTGAARGTAPEAPELRAFVRARPPVPVVFTSRSGTASFEAAAPEGDGLAYPGTVPWAAREGRLRLLRPDGTVCELTWGRPLPDGGTLIDVMGPSVSLDGTRVLFAGRRAAPDPGRWRLYEVNVDGSGLRQLTGGQDDDGCAAVPPLRFGPGGERLADADRRRLDYDDVDPTDLGPAGVAFASSRGPDLGRDHARRATQLWALRPGAAPAPLTANRNNDRWPVFTSGDVILFSSWSRNREAVTADGADVRPVSAGEPFATHTPDHWMAARVGTNGTRFGYAVKSAEPVWRPRALFNGRIAFMTGGPDGRLRLAQADWGYLRTAPSALAAGARMPAGGPGSLALGPDRDGDGREMSAGCPSPCPGGQVLCAAAPAHDPASFGLYITNDDWTRTDGRLLPLFDDPKRTDAEPVAVYARALAPEPVARAEPTAAGRQRPAAFRLANGREHTGPLGYFENDSVLDSMYFEPPEAPDPVRSPVREAGYAAPLVPPPPNVRAVAFYASHRDRFDDPDRPRVPGAWEKLAVAPLNAEGKLFAWAPADPLTPLVLVGLTAEGRVAKWAASAGAGGPAPMFYAIAGDHYSAARPNGYHYCTGCHTGHTFAPADVRERQR
ncbi:hypothetical protein R5W24_003596 [Gemmata sp. JC717]|uniref:hypothetical protein n=1 Tax=Gemmata algarum TaxID=2975278 RepID=UPI0021BB62A4|nr:hypothetical protein [Gemmata algarum]MDY3554472.1 hypothetical protein [Gemmata algarum]